MKGVGRPVAAGWQNGSLLAVWRGQLGLRGARLSCGIGQCGACVVHVNGQPGASCVLPVSEAAGTEILTIEGLAREDASLHPLQQAWLDAAVPQCGYCQSGQIMQALALLQRIPDPDDAPITQAMNGNLCRCCTYDRNRTSIKSAALVMRETR